MAQQPLDANEAEVWEKLAARAETRLQAQLTVALAADQRAMVFAGLLAAAIAALASAAGIGLTGAASHRTLGYIAICVDVGLLISMGLAIYAARPTRWCFPGSIPTSWHADLSVQRDTAEALREYCDDLSERIGDNGRIMSINGKALMSSTILAMFSLAGGAYAIGMATIWK